MQAGILKNIEWPAFGNTLFMPASASFGYFNERRISGYEFSLDNPLFYFVFYGKSFTQITMHMNYEDELQKLITKRAHELSQQRKNGGGDEFSDWLKAEQEIKQELSLRSDELFKKIELACEGRTDPYLY
jgi:hypothetical protein